MILEALFSRLRARNAAVQPGMLMATDSLINYSTTSGQTVTEESAKKLATAYRCGNIISDDVAKMPFQMYQKRGGTITRVGVDGVLRNLAYLCEIQPNRWLSPFLFKKALTLWMIYWGNAYIWMPVSRNREMYILPSNSCEPVFDENNDRWYEVTFTDGDKQYIPDVEVLHLMINSSDGIIGKSVLRYAKETLGRQLGAHETEDKFYDQGLNPAGIIWMAGDINKEAREKVREAYEESMSGSSNAHRLAILDQKVTKFEPITMKATDMQFLESMQLTDVDIANYFGMPLHKINMGKQAYNSNEQQNLDYLNTTLDPFLVQWEQGAVIKWLTVQEQVYTYFRFNRDVLLRTDAKSRGEYLEKKVFSGQLTPNEARAIEDMSAYEGGDRYYIPANMVTIKGGE